MLYNNGLSQQNIYFIQDHSRVLCEQLQQLRLQSGLVDLDIVCEVINNRILYVKMLYHRQDGQNRAERDTIV